MTSTPAEKPVCYMRNGTRYASEAYQPCGSDTSHDWTCCGINHSGAGETGVADDVCESNGLCQNFGAFDPEVTVTPKLWWRSGCTDPTWRSPYCLGDVCAFGEALNDNTVVSKCNDNEWCCGDPICCSESTSRFPLAATVGPTPTPSTSSLAATTTSTTAATSSTTREPNSTAATHSGLSTGAKAGIGAGAGVAALLLLVIGVTLGMRLKKRKRRAPSHTAMATEYYGGEKTQPESTAELHSESTIAEMGPTRAIELPGAQDKPGTTHLVK